MQYRVINKGEREQLHLQQIHALETNHYKNQLSMLEAEFLDDQPVLSDLREKNEKIEGMVDYLLEIYYQHFGDQDNSSSPEENQEEASEVEATQTEEVALDEEEESEQ